jgi:uncharacterized protein YceH (UPF0502 family)
LPASHDLAQAESLKIRGDASMRDYQTHLETLRKEAAESELISSLATAPSKRELFAKHAAHLNMLAGEVERAMIEANEEASANEETSASSTTSTSGSED